ncbi:MAG: HD domain-containing protein [Clostridia bacterium]|nr:HD domain-containing protein [Clostridia bacterium]
MKETFIQIYKENIRREGADKLLSWLETTDFFTAPASTKYHLSREGGLCEHSVNVYHRLRQLYSTEKRISQMKEIGVQYDGTLTEAEEESIAICSLLHDLCKVNFYEVEYRNKKNEETGQWEKVPQYIINDKLPYGHGEKSVYIISGFMKLTREEAMAIRFHMGLAQEGEIRDCGKAFEMYPMAFLTHMADMQATYLDEVEN